MAGRRGIRNMKAKSKPVWAFLMNAPLQTASGTRDSLQAVVGLTKSDKEFLAACPKGRWFSEDEMILWRRYQYRLRRLDVAGLAEWRGGVVGCREYHVKDNDKTEARR